MQLSAISGGDSLAIGGESCCDEALDQLLIEEIESMFHIEDDDPEDKEEETTEYEDEAADTNENEEESEDGSSGLLITLISNENRSIKISAIVMNLMMTKRCLKWPKLKLFTLLKKRKRF